MVKVTYNSQQNSDTPITKHKLQCIEVHTTIFHLVQVLTTGSEKPLTLQTILHTLNMFCQIDSQTCPDYKTTAAEIIIPLAKRVNQELNEEGQYIDYPEIVTITNTIENLVRFKYLKVTNKKSFLRSELEFNPPQWYRLLEYGKQVLGTNTKLTEDQQIPHF